MLLRPKCRSMDVHGCVALPVRKRLKTLNEKVCISTLVQDLPLLGVLVRVGMLIMLETRTDRFPVILRCMSV